MANPTAAINVAEINSLLFRLRIIVANAADNLDGEVNAAASQLTKTLQDGVLRINTESNKGLLGIGPVFASGDGTSEAAFMTILAPIRAILTRVYGVIATEGPAFTVSDYQTWNKDFMGAIKETITTLAQLYQRTESRGVIPRTQTWGHPWFQEVKDLQQNGSLQLRNISFPTGPFFNRTGSYRGTWVHKTMQRHGTGIEQWKSGTRYHGGFKHNEKHGYGIFTFEGGSYAGDFERDVYRGPGVLNMTNGVKYVGRWENGKRNGYGQNTWADGRIYRGYWKDNNSSGLGVARFVGQQMAAGSFENNVVHGYGVLIGTDGTQYTGQFAGGKREGFGVEVSADGGYYDGEFKASFRHGNGVLILTTGEQYDGQWEAGKRNGYGTRKMPGQRPLKGQWKNDQLIPAG